MSATIGCLMCDSLYVKANGELPCWDDVGEDLVLRTVDEQNLRARGGEKLFDSPELVHIRKAFLDGRTPHPDLCSKCAVHGHGLATSLHPRTIRVLHIEPAYLCQLACPQCIVPKIRLQLKKPPYYMSLSYYEALLRRLREDEIRTIRLVHFEGRGDPLLNQELGEMIRHTREMYPDSFIKVTTHGNYPFKPWMLESDFDLLRLSVDGAFEESYAKYRVGGSLQKSLDLMAEIRDQRCERPSRLRVEWKYILFDWNDSDEEIREAARLADELEVDLRFCLTHTPGRSKRFKNMDDLQVVLADCAPRATRSVTFQLKPGPRDASIRHMLAEHAEALLLSALKDFRAGKSRSATSYMIEALTFDPGLDSAELETDGENPVLGHLQRILSSAASPSTLSALANIHLVLQEWKAAEQLFRGYLRAAPDAWDKAKIEQLLIDLSVNNCLGTDLKRIDVIEIEIEIERILEAEWILLRIDPGFSESELQAESPDPARGLLPQVLTSCRYPITVWTLAGLRSLRRDFEHAEILCKHYLESAPENTRPAVLARLDGIRRARRRARTESGEDLVARRAIRV